MPDTTHDVFRSSGVRAEAVKTRLVERQTGEEQVHQQVEVWGVVQGVGFRPFVYRLATELGLHGTVCNEGSFVRIDIQGGLVAVKDFRLRLRQEAPGAARIEDLRVQTLPWVNFSTFTIEPSTTNLDHPALSIPPDLAICEDCLADMKNPSSRYFQYPFTSCTQCGPRYTLARSLPFDRETTTMDAFPLCNPCMKDYDSVSSRRFHAQATSCSQCGPELQWMEMDGHIQDRGEAALIQAKKLLLAGKVVAVMGVGGVHLAVNALDESAVARLRERKKRPTKPLAVLMDPEEVNQQCVVSLEEWESLKSKERPIVLLRRRPESNLAVGVAPGMARLGVFLPYTGIQVLLLGDSGLHCLVMTSGNVSGEPLVYTVRDALDRLSGLADGFLLHNREILRPVDDSVLRIDEGQPLLLRRSRGYVPGGFSVPRRTSRLALAVGGDVKNAFALLREGKIWLSPHIGDLENPRTLKLFTREVDWTCSLLQMQPEVVVHDLHPGYHSTQFARKRAEPLWGVQHHHAHMAACMLEHGMSGPTLGVILDGMGYGDDGNIWGGELLLGDMLTYERVGHLTPLRLIGGDTVTKEPWRGVFNVLFETGLWSKWADWAADWLEVSQASTRRLESALRSRFPGLVSTSAGRLFDVAGALVTRLGVAHFEGELPMRLEALVDPAERGAYSFDLDSSAGRLQLNYGAAMVQLFADLRAGRPSFEVATRFHRGFSQGLCRLTLQAVRDTGVRQVVVGGGVWQNEWLLRWFVQTLAAQGVTVAVPHLFPINDGGIAVGQLAVFLAQQPF